MLYKIGVVLSTICVSIFSPCPAPQQDSCNGDRGSILRHGFLPAFIEESSGLTFVDGVAYTISDSGNEPVLYSFDIERPDSIVTTELPDGIKNKDWESITSDDQANLYIADIGNNKNKREGLKFYKYHIPSQRWGRIRISYSNQTDYPPAEAKDMLFDAEATFWHDGYLYIFTKPATTGTVFLYRVSDRPGSYNLEPLTSFEGLGRVTGADINRENNEVAVLSYGRLWFLSLTETETHPELTITGCKRITKGGQVEAIAFDSNNHLYFTNENGKIFRWYD